MSLTVIVLLLGMTTNVYGAHFRGGTFHWRPLDEHNKVEVRYDMSFNGFREPGAQITGGHDVCYQEAKDNGWYLGTQGYLECHGCMYGTPESNYPDIEWQCTDFDIQGGWDIGGKTFEVTVPDGTNKLLLFYNHCCWVGPIVNVHPYDNLGWRMLTEIDLNPRPDNGLLNSSPITSPIPVQLFHKGCKYWFEIPVTDPDNDRYRCRYTNVWEDECYTTDRTDRFGSMCGELGHITIYPNCTLLFDTDGPTGYYAVRVMIEDLDQYGDPLSRISLSFLLEVSPDSSTCDAPVIIAPKQSCKIIPVGEPHKITVVAQAATESLPIVRIESNKPSGMVSSTLQDVYGYPLRKKVVLTWTPTEYQLGQYALGFNAVDQAGFSSGWTFMNLMVTAGEPLFPVPSESNPSAGQVAESANGWTITFNRPIRRPSHSAYIRLSLLQKLGIPDMSIDASDPNQVKFNGRTIAFDVPVTGNDFHGLRSYLLLVEEGVAVDQEQSECLIHSQPGQWIILVRGSKPTITPPPIIEPTIITECTPDKVDIPKPINAGEDEKCIVHPKGSSFTVTSQNTIVVPYEVCCPSSCDDWTIAIE